MNKKPLAMAVAGLALLGAAGSSYAIDTLVQYSTTGTGDGVTNGAAGNYDVTGINEFDWQSSGDLVIESAITVNGAATTLAAYFGGGAAVAGDIVVFNIHAQARLNDMLDNGGGSVAPATLDTDGATNGDQGFEITAVLDAVETATVLVGGGAGAVLQFTGITGTTNWYHDDTPDSVVETGAGFTDGTNILTANLTSVSGLFTAGTGGSNIIGTKVTSYNSAYIQTDPTSNQPLDDNTFDTLVSLRSLNEAAAIDPGDAIGQAPYIVQAADVGFKADANSEFSANPAPEPASLFLLGAGLLGLAGYRRRPLQQEAV